MNTKRFFPNAAWIFLLALLVRLVVLSRFGHSAYFSPTSGDMKFYADWGQRIAAGDWTDFHAFYGLPGYPFLLAGIFVLHGFSPYTIAFLQTLSETGIAVLIYQTAIWAFPGSRPRLIGVLASLGWMFFQPAQAFSLIVMPTTWSVLAFWSVFAWSVRTGSRSRWWPWAALGAVVGVAATLVATVILVLPIPIAAAVRNLRRPGAIFTAVACLLAGVAVGTSPCWYHNYFLAREPVFLSAHSGVNFWIGNNPDANGYPKMPTGLRPSQEGLLEDSVRIAEAQTGRPLSRAEVSRFWSAKANAYIHACPSQWAALMALKVRNFWSSTQYDDLSVINPLWEEGVLTPGLRFGWAAALAFPGIALAWKRFPRSRWIVASVLLAMVALLPVFVTERYRLVAVPGLLLLGACGIAEMGSALASRRWGRAGAWLGAGAIAFLLIHLPQNAPDLEWMEAYNSGQNALQIGNLPSARAKLERAFNLAPQNADVLTALGSYWLRENDFLKARDYYQRALQINPQTLSALNNLALLEMVDGHWAKAQALLNTALGIEPNAPKIRELAARCAWELDQQAPPVSIKRSVP